MAKGDDAIRKKKNKVNRKKMSKDASSLSARVASIVAAKQRRKSGKRRMCEGMCFSLPTLEDPFNERYSNKASNRKKAKKLAPPQADTGMSLTKDGATPRKPIPGRNSEKVEHHDSQKDKTANKKNKQRKLLTHSEEKTIPDKSGKRKIPLLGKGGVSSKQHGGFYGNSDSPSKFLILCLNAIQNALLDDGTFNSDENRPLLINTWGVEFWKCCSSGLDILETTGACSTVEQIAWIISAAADIIARKEKEGLSIATPFLLFLVPSQEKSIKVRSVCKPLKALGIHTVSLHPGASLDHQIHGLRSCEPEFLVSTPERLFELVSLGAIDISSVSLLVVDGLESFVKDGFLDKMNSIKQSVSGDHQTVIFNNCLGNVSTSAVQNLLGGPICRLSLSDSIASQSACISQCVQVCTSKEEKLTKSVQILKQAYVNQLCSLLPKVLFIAETNGKAQLLATNLIDEGFSISNNAFGDSSEVANSEKRTVVSVIDKEHITRTDMGEFEVVMLVDLPLLIDDYVKILTRMARHTVNGVLHSFFCQEDALLAGPLIEVLEQCGQTVPDTLRNYLDSSSMLEH